jgi:membrane-bound metal-dependent hydrolase YbcI (DUF457 family)
MPFPTYHVGTNAFFGLALRRWLDPAVIIGANVIVDLEVLFSPGFPETHRHWYFHTFLVGGIIGALFGLACWFFRDIISWAMKLLRIPYKPSRWKMALAGTVGMWIHVLLDSFWHFDVQPLRPFSSHNPFYRMLKHTRPHDQVHRWIIIICTTLSIAALILYIRTVIKYNSKKPQQK